MCKIFASLSYDDYGFQTRSVRLGGYVTSIRLEAMFWKVLEEIAAREGLSLGRFLSALHDEVLAFERSPQNFASLLRCACLTHLRRESTTNDAASRMGAIDAVDATLVVAAAE
jgi:predicted DNA-binding ribbon-helix-helix protein